jgi:hypothetical protein
MIYDYVIIGNNINSMMLAYYLSKEDNKVIILEKKNKEDFYLYTKNNIVYRNPLYSNNDVNFLNFLNDIKVDFKNIGNKITLNFNLLKRFELNELYVFCIEFLNEFMYNYKSKQIKLQDKVSSFSDKSIEYIKYLCRFYDYDFNEISYYEFMQIINNCIMNDFYNIDENKILDYFLNNINIEIKFGTEFKKISNKIIQTNFNEYEFTKKCIFCISPEKINFYKNEIIETHIYNYCLEIGNNKPEHNNIISYLQNNNHITFFFNYKNTIKTELEFIKTDREFIKTELEFIKTDREFIKTDREFIKTDREFIITKKEFKEEKYFDNYILINNNKLIECNIKRNYNLLNKLINKKKYRIYKNDTIVDIIKLYLMVKLFVK